MKKLMIVVIMLAFFSCKKQDEWLDIKSNKADITPVTLSDFQSLVTNDAVLNLNYPGFGILASDNYYMSYESWKSLSVLERNAYLWKPDIYEGGYAPDWENQYKKVGYSNIILDGLEKVGYGNSDEKTTYDMIKGSALFFRSFAFYNLLQEFAVPYDSASALNAPGIPLRLESNINTKSVRAGVGECYAQVVQDLQKAKELLPASVSFKTKPSKAAALALLARVSLAMKSYQNAARYASEALSFQNTLTDFNNLNASASYPFPYFPAPNNEIIFYAESVSFFAFFRSNLKVDTVLFSSYDIVDLRRTFFYKDNGVNGISFKGDYSGFSLPVFAGLATNELYLIKAECEARLNKQDEAKADIDFLLQNRYKAGTYLSPAFGNSEQLLDFIVMERRKELPFTGNLRWEDLRRLNQNPFFAKTLARILNGEVFTLPPRDKRYVYPIPDNEIRLSGIQQNPR